MFTVIDRETGKAVDAKAVACAESWARTLDYTRLAGFALTQDSGLVLLDTYGNAARCPTGRFTVQFNSVVPLLAFI